MYKTVVIEYSPKTDNMAQKVEEKANEMLQEGYELITMSITGTAKAILVLGMSKTLKKLNNISNKKIIIATVGLSDPTDEVNKNNIRNNIKNQITKEVFEKAKIFHLRGRIDYSELNFAHKTMMKLLYNAVKSLPEEKQSAEDRAVIETYNKKVNFIDFSSLDKIITEVQK